MPKEFEELFDETLRILWRQFIIYGSEEPALDKWQVESVRILIMGGVKPQDFAYAVGQMQSPTFDLDREWDFVCAEALRRRADINFEIAEAE